MTALWRPPPFTMRVGAVRATLLCVCAVGSALHRAAPAKFSIEELLHTKFPRRISTNINADPCKGSECCWIWGRAGHVLEDEEAGRSLPIALSSSRPLPPPPCARYCHPTLSLTRHYSSRDSMKYRSYCPDGSLKVVLSSASRCLTLGALFGLAVQPSVPVLPALSFIPVA